MAADASAAAVPLASACLPARAGSPGWRTGARLRARWPSPLGRGAEWDRPLLTKASSSPVWAAGLEQTLPVPLTSPHPASKRGR